MWCNHPDLLPIVQDSFSTENNILRAIEVFISRVTIWNKHMFGIIFYKKRHILSRLTGIQKSNVYPYNSFLQELESNPQDQFNAILKNEYDFRKLKSKINWLCKGDANTKIFYTSTLNRRRRNMILSLKSEVCNLILEPHHIKETILNYVSKIFTLEHHFSNRQSSYNVKRSNVLDSIDEVTLNFPHRLSEIKCALNFFIPMKAPGPDELHLCFTKHIGKYCLNK